MTDTAADPTSDDTGTTDAGLVEHDGIVLTRTGWIRATIAGQTYQLRRPFLGEFRDLRGALTEIEDQLADEQDRVGGLLGQVTDGIKQVADGDMGADEAKALAQEARAANRALLALSEDLRLEWWQQVFDRLEAHGKVPPDWPSWCVDIDLPVKIVQHWRSAPLAPGH